jgi:hypothetical protein
MCVRGGGMYLPREGDTLTRRHTQSIDSESYEREGGERGGEYAHEIITCLLFGFYGVSFYCDERFAFLRKDITLQ